MVDDAAGKLKGRVFLRNVVSDAGKDCLILSCCLITSPPVFTDVAAWILWIWISASELPEERLMFTCKGKNLAAYGSS